jgi:hypothetical protein
MEWDWDYLIAFFLKFEVLELILKVGCCLVFNKSRFSN